MYTLDNKPLKSFITCTEATNFLREKINRKVSSSHISNAAKGKIKHAYNLVWKINEDNRYVNNEENLKIFEQRYKFCYSGGYIIPKKEEITAEIGEICNVSCNLFKN